MAERQAYLSSLKEQFGNQLTCSVCLDQYTNPKILPCHHSFCLKCIEPIPVEIKDRKCFISCPVCRNDHLLPQGGASNLPNDFRINSMLDLQNKLVTSTLKQKFITTGPNPTQCTCPKHNDLLKVYCETCCQVICRDCTISTEHNKHTFYLISECYPKHHQQILDNLHPIKHKLAGMDTAMTHLDTRESEVLLQGENIKEEINQHAQKLIDDIQRSRTHLTQQVDTIVQQKTQTLATQRQQAQKIRTQLQTCQDTIEHNLKEWTQQQILARKHTMIEEMNTATQHVDPTMFQPIENANITFNTNKNKIEIGVITSKTYSEATVKVSPCLAKQPLIVTLQSQDGSPLPHSLISSTLSSSGNTHTVKCPIIQTQPGKHNTNAFTRQDPLKVQVGGINSTSTLSVIPTPEMRWKPVNITGLDRPHGIAVYDNGNIVVAEQDAHCVTILNKEGKKLKSIFGTKQVRFTNPYGVAISSDGYILVTDKHQLQKITTAGKQVESVGTGNAGSGQSQFNTPDGIAVHPMTGQIFIADSGNNRIQVFTNDLTFSRTITPSGQPFNHPRDVAIDSEGYLYVAEWGNHCIKKLCNSGKNVTLFASTTHGFDPTSLAIHNNLVYICEACNNRVSVYDTDGKLVRHLHAGEKRTLVYPYGITVDSLENVYISDFVKNRIVMF